LLPFAAICWPRFPEPGEKALAPIPLELPFEARADEGSLACDELALYNVTCFLVAGEAIWEMESDSILAPADTENLSPSTTETTDIDDLFPIIPTK
jgi:hypothetical protein